MPATILLDDLFSDGVCSGQRISDQQLPLGFEFRRFDSGAAAGVQVVSLVCGDMNVAVVPTRGMGIVNAACRGVRFGWDSPIGLVHPALVQLSEPSGLGWLDGFSELVARCGLISNGAPEFDERGQLRYPLHGRIANLPAHSVEISIDESANQIAIRGVVSERRFHFHALDLAVEISLQADSNEIKINDTVWNRSDRPIDFQMIYHNNFGPPLLEAGSRFHAPVKRLVPRNAHASHGVATWDSYRAPDPAYAEEVFFAQLAGNEAGQTATLLTNEAGSIGASVCYNTASLPCFTLWKNTVGLNDGYVTGLEPGTNFPNNRSFEHANGRTVPLVGGAHWETELRIGLLTSPDEVAASVEQISALAPATPELLKEPCADWCQP